MLYKICDDVEGCEIDDIGDNDLIVGYLSINELKSYASCFNINSKAVMECENDSIKRNSCVDSWDNFLLLRLDIKSPCRLNFSIIILKNKLLIIDDSASTLNKIFMPFLDRALLCDGKIEKLIFIFFEIVLDYDNVRLDAIQKKATKIERAIENETVKSKFNLSILNIKNELMSMRKHANFIIDVAQRLSDNYNELFEVRELKYFKFIDNKVQRLKDSIDFLNDSVMHLREAYQSLIELRLNKTMKLFTSFTVLFYPVSIISSWYGMNFKNMILINSEYGYIATLLLSVTISVVLFIIFKFKKLF